MRFTIAVPSLNYAQFIDDCLESILAQDHEDFEVLICDGGSTDGSLDIIRRFAGRDRRFSLLGTTDSGQADAIDRAFQAATGQILCYLNADDVYLEKNVLSLTSRVFSNDPELGVLSFRSNYIDPAGRRLGLVNARVHPGDRLSWIKYRGQVVQPSAFWRAGVYRRFPFNTRWHYCFDWAFFYQAYGQFKFEERPEIVAGYRLHGANKSTGVSWKRIAELAEFEDFRFGPGSLRGSYMRSISSFVRRTTSWGKGGAVARRIVYYFVNVLSFASFYRLPGI